MLKTLSTALQWIHKRIMNFGTSNRQGISYKINKVISEIMTLKVLIAVITETKKLRKFRTIQPFSQCSLKGKARITGSVHHHLEKVNYMYNIMRTHHRKNDKNENNIMWTQTYSMHTGAKLGNKVVVRFVENVTNDNSLRLIQLLSSKLDGRQN